MLDIDRKSVIEVLRKLTGEDGIFKIIEAEEVLELLPSDIDMNKQKLSGIIRDLRDLEYIKVKYFTPDEYCLLTLKHVEDIPLMHEEGVSLGATQFASQTAERKVETIVQNVQPPKLKMVFLAAFLGALLGGGVITVIAIVLQKLVF